jgi:hypothetical protein
MLDPRAPTSMMFVPVGTVHPTVCPEAREGASTSANVTAESHLSVFMMPS